MIGRRAVVVTMAAALAGCGFHPVYGVGQASRTGLPSVYVDVIANRPGQLLRQALQARLDGAGEAARHYTLSVFYGESARGIGIEANNFTTRNRDVGLAYWSLHRLDAPGTYVTGGTVRSVDGYNIIDEQFFYQDLSEEAAQRRLADALADQIVLALGLYFNKHPAAR